MLLRAYKSFHDTNGISVKENIRVLVTGVGGRSVGNQILHALLLREKDYIITAVDADPFSFGLYEVDRRFIIPRAYDRRYIEAMISLIRSEGIQVVLPGTEAELFVLSQNRGLIEATGSILLAARSEVIGLCANKVRLAEWLNARGFGIPRMASVSEWRNLARETGFPLVGKPVENTGGSRNVVLLKDETEILKYLDESSGTEVFFQEYIADSEGEFTVGVCMARDGKVIDSIVLRRKLIGLSLGAKRTIAGKDYTISTGYSQGYIINHPRIRSLCEQLASALHISGPLNIQCRVIHGEVKVFEVHPRFSGTTSIRADVGFNEPDILIRNFLGGEIFERINYQINVAAIRAFRSCIVPTGEMESVKRIL